MKKTIGIFLVLVIVFYAVGMLHAGGGREEDRVEESMVDESEVSFEEQIAMHVANNPTINLVTSSDFFLQAMNTVAD